MLVREPGNVGSGWIWFGRTCILCEKETEGFPTVVLVAKREQLHISFRAYSPHDNIRSTGPVLHHLLQLLLGIVSVVRLDGYDKLAKLMCVGVLSKAAINLVLKRAVVFVNSMKQLQVSANLTLPNQESPMMISTPEMAGASPMVSPLMLRLFADMIAV